MKKVLSFITVLMMVLGINNVKALQSDYRTYGLSPYDDYKLDTETGIIQIYNYQKYQFQTFTKENYDKIMSLEEQYSKDLEELDDKRNKAADEVVSKCEFDKTKVLNWCSSVGGPGCENIEYNEDTISEECSTAITNYSPYRGEYTTSLNTEYKNKIYELLPDIDESKWTEIKDKKVTISSDLGNYQILYTKNTFQYENSTYDNYGYAIFYKENEQNTNTEKVEEVKADDKTIKDNSSNTVNNTKKNEKNPKTGIYTNYIYALIIILASFITYLNIRKIRKFNK
jgi:hypothetical protein